MSKGGKKDTGPTVGPRAGEAEDLDFSMDEIAAEESARRMRLVRAGEGAAQMTELAQVRAAHSDIVARGRAMRHLVEWHIPHMKVKRDPKTGEVISAAPEFTDQNAQIAFNALFGRSEEDGAPNYYLSTPHLCTFSGRAVDHHGTVIKSYHGVAQISAALSAMQLDHRDFKTLLEKLKFWVAEEHMKWNTLSHRFKSWIPEWDGKKRLDSLLAELMECNLPGNSSRAKTENALTKRVAAYFWQSVYWRITMPGSIAPISLTLIGSQDAGKSYFWKKLCWFAMGANEEDAAAQPVPLDFRQNTNTFLRKITGKSVVANCGELVGFNSTEIERVKAFATATTDPLDFKFMDDEEQPRQWIIGMDSNKYEGIHRDDTGNRRFYPVFVGRAPDEDGKPAWRADFKWHFDAFSREVFWQVMAECRELDRKEGYAAYVQTVSSLNSAVRDFSLKEMSENRGTNVTETFAAWVALAVNETVPVYKTNGKDSAFIRSADIVAHVVEFSRGKLNAEYITKHITSAVGGIVVVKGRDGEEGERWAHTRNTSERGEGEPYERRGKGFTHQTLFAGKEPFKNEDGVLMYRIGTASYESMAKEALKKAAGGKSGF